jgi:alkylglycerol monooxygenase
MPTGWRPADAAEKYPAHKIADVYHFEKYDPKFSKTLATWSWFQLIMILLFVSYLFGNIGVINKLDASYIYLYGGFVFLAVYSFTDLMDRNRYAIVWEVLKNGFGIAIIYRQGDWFGASVYVWWINYALIIYFILSTAICGWFVYKHYKEDYQQLSVSL